MLNTNPILLRFPRDTLRFLYWVFFKPTTINQYLRAIDIQYGKSIDIYIIWQRRKKVPQFVPLIKLVSFHVLVTPWLLTLLAAIGFSLANIEVNLFALILWTAAGIVFGFFLTLGANYRT